MTAADPDLSTLHEGLAPASLINCDQTGRAATSIKMRTLTYHRARRDVILMPITSQVRGSGEFGEVIVQDWQSAGLLKPSAIKPVLATFERSLIRKTLGRLSSSDQQSLRDTIETLFG